MSEPVGALVELPVSDYLAVRYKRRRTWSGGGLFGYQLGNARIPGIVLPGIVPVRQALLLTLCQQRHRRVGLLPIRICAINRYSINVLPRFISFRRHRFTFICVTNTKDTLRRGNRWS